MGTLKVNTIYDAAGTGGPEIKGNIGASLSSAGMRGEYFAAHTTAATDTPATNTFGNIFALSITAGNYLAWGNLQNTRGGGQLESYAAVSTFSQNTVTDHVAGFTQVQNTINIGGADVLNHCIGPIPYETTGGFTLYLKGKQELGTWGTANWAGSLLCLRR